MKSMKKYLMLVAALVSVLCVFWAIVIGDFGMVVFCVANFLFCIYAQIALSKENAKIVTEDGI